MATVDAAVRFSYNYINPNIESKSLCKSLMSETIEVNIKLLSHPKIGDELELVKDFPLLNIKKVRWVPQLAVPNAKAIKPHKLMLICELKDSKFYSQDKITF